ncbi:crotonase/enoyl-CoA hydratase family protein [Arenicella xantha]|uniref:Enoyl-CoA hydratase/carnithine racemase n=1 Tax=Arenicella xantha TaxID=644221 RepID=A0A395JKR2_9GAMM|nr:crotonase/enoyl-CoA hydratase family protein [Arenicella xantha]RBP49368.1 enoyl-CoA hydratase/carnithine racemase [Arenicella xantha]
MINDRIELTVDNHIAHVRLARPEKMNALDVKMFEAITMVGEQLKSDRSVRVVVLSGDGGNFCAGLDKSNFTSILEKAGSSKSSEPESSDSDNLVTNLAKRTHGIANAPQYAAWMWRELPMPVIAAVQGVALGGGLQIALGADFRYGSADSRYSILELKWGIVPDMSSTQIMRHLVRDDVIRELTYTAKIFTAEQAKEWGFITDIVADPLAHAMQTAADIVAKNPHAIRSAKRIIDQSYYLDQAQGLLMESEEQDQIMGQPNQIEAVMATLQGREPNFKD